METTSNNIARSHVQRPRLPSSNELRAQQLSSVPCLECGGESEHIAHEHPRVDAMCLACGGRYASRPGGEPCGERHECHAHRARRSMRADARERSGRARLVPAPPRQVAQLVVEYRGRKRGG